MEKLKTASMSKKKTAVKNLTLRSHDPENLFYLDPKDPVLSDPGSDVLNSFT